MADYSCYFSASYIEARTRFRALVAKHNGQHQSFNLEQTAPTGEQLSVDVARFGADDAPHLLILSSGTHGVEGFFGSAVQLAFIEDRLKDLVADGDTAVLLIHAVNPFGFSHLRRVNENNIDLNRNCLEENQPYSGAHPGYTRLNAMLNPESTPSKWDMFLPQAVWNIARHGLPALKNSIAQGQYDFPKGLFFGGTELSQSMTIIQDNLPKWVGSATSILHLDLHTGLGKWGTYVLASPADTSEAINQSAAQYFGADVMQSLQQGKVLYTIRGEFGGFCRNLFPQCDYLSLLAEFGTYPVLKVIAALRHENRMWHWGQMDSPERVQAAEALKETFAPASSEWQHITVEKALKITDQAQRYLHRR